ncbi:glycosyltransferase [Burkholderia multivorans]|uniref:glycosyltransferase n=1 Tax=Burkholderia multivorans TaxID=87883 RepID=UPI00075C6612|nr:glycosyltransferase [Burkholderia multivorans]KVT41573.1 glycosyl transferase [Burkholderia multivorans]
MNVKSTSPSCSCGLSISIVVYYPDRELLWQTFETLRAACGSLQRTRPDVPIELFLVDNGGLGDVQNATIGFRAQGVSCRVLTGQGNVGYGRGHNLAIEQAHSQFHLILNPDVDLDEQAFVAAYAFFEEHTDLGLLAPKVTDKAGGLQYLCRRFPTVVDLFVRGFMPAPIRRVLARRLERYEMRDAIGDGTRTVWDPPIVSGCFMLYRTAVLKRLGGFAPCYFLYFEDYDLTLRTHDIARVAYVPTVQVVHHGGGASRKGLAHIRMFVASAFKFYNRFGWRLW